MATRIYSRGTATVTVSSGEKIAVFSEAATSVYQKVGYPNQVDSWDLLTTVTNQEYLSSAFTADTEIRIDAGVDGAQYDTGASPQVGTPTTDITAADDPLQMTGLASTQGGAVNIAGGTSSTSANAGGATTLTGGTPGATGVGGAASVTGGAGGSTSGAGGATAIAGGAGTAGNSAGGAASVTGGAGSGTQAGGAGSVGGGAGGATGVGGAANVTAGAGGATSGNGGVSTVVGGAGTAGNAAGGVGRVLGGAGQGTGAGGASQVTGGASGAGATGNGGQAAVTGGAAASTDGNGGSVVLTGGALAGSGVNGHVQAKSLLTQVQGTPNAQTTVATLTIANLLTGIVTGTHTAGADQAYTLPTGTLTDAALQLAADDSFDWTLINLSAAAADTVTVTAGADHTVVGVMVVQSAHATTGGLYGNAGRFRTRKTAANTYVTYRIG